VQDALLLWTVGLLICSGDPYSTMDRNSPFRTGVFVGTRDDVFD